MRDKDQILLEQAYADVYNPINEGVGEFTIKRGESEYAPADPPEHAWLDNTYHQYDIIRNNEKVGELERDEYLRSINGTLYNKKLPRLNDYGWGSSSQPLSNLHAFLKSPDGKKWAKDVKELQGFYKLDESVSRRSVQDIVFNKRSDVTEQDLRQAVFAALDRDKSISNAYGESPIYIQDIELNGDEVKIPLEQPITSNDANYFIIRVHDALEHQYDPDQGQLVDTINPSAIDEAARCTKVTKKASSDRKDKKYMKCVKSDSGYKRIHWGDPNAKVTGKSGNTKRKKSFKARHKCSTAKADTPRGQACRDWA